MELDKALVAVGKIAGPYGIKGWLRIISFTDPAENLFMYSPWQLIDAAGKLVPGAPRLLEYRPHGKGWVGRFDGIADRTAAEALQGFEIAVERAALPEPDDGSYYWADLEGLRVEDESGQVLGRIDHFLATGSADVMVIVGDAAGERHLVPFIPGETVTNVDLGARCVRVDWQAD